MFFRVLSAMLTADAIDRHIRTQQPRYWYPQAPPTDGAVHRPGQPPVAVRQGAHSLLRQPGILGPLSGPGSSAVGQPSRERVAALCLAQLACLGHLGQRAADGGGGDAGHLGDL